MNKLFTNISAYFFSDSFRIPPAVFVLLVTLFSFGWVLGYSVYEGDQLIYFPELLKRLDPGLFPRDLIFSQDGFTFFDDAILAGIRILRLDIFSVLCLMVFALRFVYFWGVYKIFKNLTGDRPFSLLAPLLYLSAFVVYGTGMRTIAPMLLPRDIGIAFGLLALGYLLSGKRLSAACSLGIGILFHPAILVPFLVIFYLSFFFDASPGVSVRGVAAFLAPLVSFFVLYLFIPPGEGIPFFQVLDSAWREVILKRDSYYFLTTWYYPNSAPLYITASVFFFFLARKELSDIFGDLRKRMFVYACFLVPLVLAVLSLILVDWAGLVLATQFSFGRGLLLWKIVLNGLFAYYAYRHIRSHPRDSMYNFFLLGVGISFVLGENLIFMFLPAHMFMWSIRKFPASRLPKFADVLRSSWVAVFVFFASAPVAGYFAFLHENDGFFQAFFVALSIALLVAVFFRIVSVWEVVGRAAVPLVSLLLLLGVVLIPTRFSIDPAAAANPSFLEACDWVKKNTSKEDLFITEPFTSESGPLRLMCHRGLFGTRKDGGQVVFNRAFALEWDRRYHGAIKAMGRDPASITDIAREYKVEYVFSDSPLNLPKKVFDNGVYYVYRFEGNAYD